MNYPAVATMENITRDIEGIIDRVRGKAIFNSMDCCNNTYQILDTFCALQPAVSDITNGMYNLFINVLVNIM